MPKNDVSSWDTTPANNTDVGGVDLAENSMRPRDVNNAIRTMMAQLKTFLGGTVPGFLDGILTTRGDILRRGATTTERYALGTSGYALKSDGTDAVWAPSRETLITNRTLYVGAPIPTPTITIATPAVVTSTAHGLSANDPVVFNVPQNTTAGTISAANPAVVTMSNSFAAGQPVKFASTGSLPYGIVPGTTYYVIATGLSGSQFQFSATVGGAAISTAAPTATFTNGSANIGITTANTYYSVGQTVRFATTGGLPTNFAVATDYYIITASSTTITVSATATGSAIVAGSAGTGTQTAVQSGTHQVTTTGALPTGVTEGTVYYVIATGLTANAFQISATLAGAAVNTSGSVTGSPIYNAYTGNDANNGLTQTRAGALLTIQRAIDLGAGVDTSIYNLTAQLANGAYLTGCTLKPCVGAGQFTIQGNSSLPSNVLVSTTSANCFGFSDLGATGYTIKDLEMRTTTSGGCIFGQGFGHVSFSNVRFGLCAGGHISAYFRSQIEASGSFVTSGGAFWGKFSAFGGFIGIAGVTETYVGLPAFSGANMNGNNLSNVRLEASTFVGAATGKKYTSTENSVIQTGGMGVNAPPGNTIGTTATGGIYA